MKRILAAVLCMVVPTAVLAEETGYKITYDGGSIPETKAGTGLKMFIEGNQVRFVRDKKDFVTIPASAGHGNQLWSRCSPASGVRNCSWDGDARGGRIAGA